MRLSSLTQSPSLNKSSWSDQFDSAVEAIVAPLLVAGLGFVDGIQTCATFNAPAPSPPGLEHSVSSTSKTQYSINLNDICSLRS